MAKRLTVQANRESLYEFLKSSCTNGNLIPGTMLPPVRELSEQHGVTNHAVFQVIQRLTDEGVLYTVPRVGAFIGHPPRETVEPYLMVVPSHQSSRDHYLMQAQLGFEDRIAQLGGHSIILTPEETHQHLQQSELPPLAGVFESLESLITSSRLFEGSNVHSALFGNLEESGATSDCVSFDDIGGGAMAAHHLWQNGHRNIAFLALHSEGDGGIIPWSLRREIGWRQALEQAGGETEGLAFYPKQTSAFSIADQRRASREAALQLVGRNDITAVLAVNALAAEVLFETFLEANWPIEKWPAIVCFDTAPGTGRSVVSYLRLPWENIGKEVAQILWERRTGRLTGPAVQRLVPMRLIPRLSCRSDWVVTSGLTQSRFFSAAPQPHQETHAPQGVEIAGV